MDNQNKQCQIQKHKISRNFEAIEKPFFPEKNGNICMLFSYQTQASFTALAV